MDGLQGEKAFLENPLMKRVFLSAFAEDHGREAVDECGADPPKLVERRRVLRRIPPKK